MEEEKKEYHPAPKRAEADSTTYVKRNIKYRGRHWCFTDFNMGYWNDYIHSPHVSYIVMGEEICPKTGKHHIQGYIEFENARTLDGLKKNVSDSAHWETRKGTSEEASAYCKKEGEFFERGTLSHQGERTDFQALLAAIKENKSDIELIEQFGSMAFRCQNHIAKVRLMTQPKRDWLMEARVYWGDPATGKSKAVFDEFKPDEIYVKDKTKWWDNYKGEKVVLIDDFDPTAWSADNWSFDFWLNLFDRYPMQVEFKGGYANFSSKIIIITSNYDPKIWFTRKQNIKALWRRVTNIVFFENTNKEMEQKGPVDFTRPLPNFFRDYKHWSEKEKERENEEMGAEDKNMECDTECETDVPKYNPMDFVPKLKKKHIEPKYVYKEFVHNWGSKKKLYFYTYDEFLDATGETKGIFSKKTWKELKNDFNSDFNNT